MARELSRSDRIYKVFKQFLTEAYNCKFEELFEKEEEMDILWDKVGEILDEYDEVSEKLHDYYCQQSAIEGEP